MSFSSWFKRSFVIAMLVFSLASGEALAERGGHGHGGGGGVAAVETSSWSGGGGGGGGRRRRGRWPFIV